MTGIGQKITDILGPEGSLSKLSSGFVYRAEQFSLARRIEENFSNKEFLLAEVGTGIGKTLAYLVTAFLWADSQGEKVVIATRTRALQQQILTKEVPLLRSLLDTDVTVVEAVGRENFLCWHKYVSLMSGFSHLEAPAVSFMQHIHTWAEQTADGKRSELSLGENELKYWYLVAADRHSCLQDECIYRQRCFRMKMAKKINLADIIITNHALLLADVMADNSILPSYRYLLIDEAHNFAQEIFERLSLQFSWLAGEAVFKRLYYQAGRQGKGLLSAAALRWPEQEESLAALQAITLSATEKLDLCFQQIDLLAKTSAVEPEESLLLYPAMLEKKEFAAVIDTFTDWQATAALLAQHLHALLEEMDADKPELQRQLRNAQQELTDLLDIAFQVMEEQLYNAEATAWLHYKQGKIADITVSALGNSTLLTEKLYGQLDSLIMLSATLTVADDFSSIIDRTGLSAFREEKALNTLMEKSPFNYQENSAVYVPLDLPDPADKGFMPAALQLLGEVILQADTPTLILFTAKKQLQQASEYLRPLLAASGFNLLVQGEDGEYQTIVQRFINEPKSVLIGVATFWEGVDIKGDCLKLLVLAKLPFRSPTEPYCRAWEVYYQQCGKNNFFAFMLPEAVIRFKQGLGRLLRSEEDRGAVIVLDKRLLTKNYGRFFVESLPDGLVKATDCAQLSADVRPWLE